MSEFFKDTLILLFIAVFGGDMLIFIKFVLYFTCLLFNTYKGIFNLFISYYILLSFKFSYGRFGICIWSSFFKIFGNIIFSISGEARDYFKLFE